MTIEEWRIAARHLKTMYPNEKFMPKEEYADMWYSYLSDLEYVYVRMAVKNWVANNSYYPTVGDIRTKALVIMKETKAKLSEIKDIFNTCHSYYPSNLTSDKDWDEFKECIKSEQFEEAKAKAFRIKHEIMNTLNIDKSFKEYINEISRTECD